MSAGPAHTMRHPGKVLLCLEGLPLGGGTITALELGHALKAAGWEVVVYAAPGPAEVMIAERGLRYVPAPSGNRWLGAGRIVAMVRVCRRERPTLVHAWDWRAIHTAHVGAWLMCGLPVLGSITEMRVPPGVPRRMHVTAVTEDLGREHPPGRGRVHVLDPPINDILDDPLVVDDSEFRRTYFDPDRRTHIVIVSRLAHHMKADGIHRTIRAVAAIDEAESVELLIVGDGDAEAELRRTAEMAEAAAGRHLVTFVGPMVDPRPAYKAADIVVGMGTSAARAMAFAKPVVVVGEEGFCRTFTPESSAALIGAGFYGLVPLADEPALVDQLAHLVRDTAYRDEIGARSQPVIVERFGVVGVARHLSDIYDEVLADPEPRGLRSIPRALRETWNALSIIQAERRARASRPREGGRSRVIVYYPSFAHWGGGEKQTLLTAAALSADHDVVLCTEHAPPPAAISAYFGIDLGSARIDPLGPGGPVITRLLGSRQRMRRWQHALVRWSHGRQLGRRQADLLFSVEPSPPIAPRHTPSIYACNFPFGDDTVTFHARVSVRAYHAACRALERVLLGDPVAARSAWTKIVANSEYTATWIERLWHRQAEVIYPPCDDMGPPAPKEPMILSVGRFQAPTTTLHTKSFDEVIAAFGQLCNRSEARYELHLAGHCGADRLSLAYVDELRDRAAGLPVFFHLSIDHDGLRDLYRRSSLFWLATGYGFDPERFPGKQEHFGIVTVEAMSAGAVPVLRNAGGSVEIIGGLGIGALWETQEELVSASLALLGDPDVLASHAARSVQRAREFNSDDFTRRTRAIAAGALGRPFAPVGSP